MGVIIHMQNTTIFEPVILTGFYTRTFNKTDDIFISKVIDSNFYCKFNIFNLLFYYSGTRTI